MANQQNNDIWIFLSNLQHSDFCLVCTLNLLLSLKIYFKLFIFPVLECAYYICNASWMLPQNVKLTTSDYLV